MQVEDLLEMIVCLRVFKLPNFEARGELALGFWWHINPDVAYKKLMLQSYFLARGHFYICDKFVHGPTEKDEVCLRGYVSRLVCDEMAVTVLEACSQEAGQMLGRTLGFSHPHPGVVGWCEGAVYLTSPGRPTDIGLQLGKAAILVVGKGRGGMFLFLLFLHFHSCSSFFPVPLFHLLYSLFYLFSPFLWETTQNDPQGLTCR